MNFIENLTSNSSCASFSYNMRSGTAFSGPGSAGGKKSKSSVSKPTKVSKASSINEQMIGSSPSNNRQQRNTSQSDERLLVVSGGKDTLEGLPVIYQKVTGPNSLQAAASTSIEAAAVQGLLYSTLDTREAPETRIATRKGSQSPPVDETLFATQKGDSFLFGGPSPSRISPKALQGHEAAGGHGVDSVPKGF